MKKFILGAAFMLCGTFAFANNICTEKTIDEKTITENYVVETTNFSKDVVGTCYLLVTIRDKNGTIISKEVWTVTDVPANYTCELVAQIVEAIIATL